MSMQGIVAEIIFFMLIDTIHQLSVLPIKTIPHYHINVWNCVEKLSPPPSLSFHYEPIHNINPYLGRTHFLEWPAPTSCVSLNIPPPTPAPYFSGWMCTQYVRGCGGGGGRIKYLDLNFHKLTAHFLRSLGMPPPAPHPKKTEVVGHPTNSRFDSRNPNRRVRFQNPHPVYQYHLPCSPSYP